MLRLGWMLLVLGLVFSCNKRPKRNIAFYNNIQIEPTTLNPITSTDGYSVDVHSYIFESLLDVDEDTYDWRPLLATKWEISEDKTKFTFWLREGVKWHDGVELTAEDVKFSFDVNFDVERWKNAHKQFLYENIKSVKVLDKYKVEVEVKSKVYSNFDIVAGTMKILPKHFYAQQKKKSYFNKTLIGTGPYKLSAYYRGNRIVLEKNENWWARDIEPYKKMWNFPKVVLRWVSDGTVSLQMLKKGAFDFLGLQPEDYVKKAVGPVWGKKVHKVKTKNNSPKGYCYIGMNFTDPILKDKKVRKALYHLVNRKLMIQKFEYNMSTPAVGPIYPSSPYANKSLKPVEFDPKKALALFNQAGWRDTDGDNILDKNGKKLSLTILEPGRYEKYLTIFKEDAKKAGVDIVIKKIEWNSFIKLVTDEKKFQMCRLCWSASIDWDPKQIWHSSSIKGGSNFISYSNKEVDKLIDKARYIFDRNERIKVLSKVEKQIVDDVPYLFLTYKDSTLYAHTDRIQKERDTYKFTIGLSYWKFKSLQRMTAE